MRWESKLILALPSDGALHESTLTFLHSCGIGVLRTNVRRYTGQIPAIPGVSVLFQRSGDIPLKVEDGSADLGIVGLDRFMETRREDWSTDVIIESLGFGQCELVLGIPDSWVDITSLSDLADLSIEFREEGRDLRIATKYPRLVEKFLLHNGVNYFSLVQSSGTLEAAPAMGSSDIIADISSSGITLRENRLKTVSGGTVFTSEASLITNNRLLSNGQGKLEKAKAIVEILEGHLQSQEFYSITANIQGESADQIASYILDHPDISGLQGPTISRVYTRNKESWYAITIIVEKEKLLASLASLRGMGGDTITVSQLNYLFHAKCKSHARLT